MPRVSRRKSKGKRGMLQARTSGFSDGLGPDSQTLLELAGELDDGIAAFAAHTGLPTGESQELNSQELVASALYATDFLTGAEVGEALPQLSELPEMGVVAAAAAAAAAPRIAILPDDLGLDVLASAEDPHRIATETNLIRGLKKVKEYAAHTRPPETYGEVNVESWGTELAHYRKLAMHQKGKLKPIIISDADIRRLSYVPREHALRKGAASLAKFRTAYAKLFDLCDDGAAADAFLLFLRRKLNDKHEKYASKVRKAETVREMKQKEKKVETENRFLKERVSRLERQVTQSKKTLGPPVVGKRRSLRKIKSVPF